MTPTAIAFAGLFAVAAAGWVYTARQRARDLAEFRSHAEFLIDLSNRHAVAAFDARYALDRERAERSRKERAEQPCTCEATALLRTGR